MKKIVVSGINLDSGGPLSIMNDCLQELSKNYSLNYEIIALVHSRKLYNIPHIIYKEYPLSKKFWLFRLYYEYIYFYFLSSKIKPDFWLSMHDMTPNIKCKKKFVYCHNATPFLKSTKKDAFKHTKIYLFSLFYKYLYKINIKSNTYVIVQQGWMRDAFERFWNLKNILVAYPETNGNIYVEHLNDSVKHHNTEVLNFFYPSFPRFFKNFEIVCEAYSLMPEGYRDKCNIYLTIDGTLNGYSKEIVDKYSNQKGIKFLGLLSRKQVYEYYKKSDCLIFPSKLESWGLPITEYKSTGKPMLLANKPYAKETLGEYEKVAFFDVDSANELKILMMGFIDNSIIYTGNLEVKLAEPFTKGWSQFFNKLLHDN